MKKNIKEKNIKRNFKLKTNPPTLDEKNLFGIFISHSNSETDKEYLAQLVEKMEAPENNLTPIFDRRFLQGGEHFHKKIKECIKSYACVIIISRSSINSDWVHYECGCFSHSRNPVIIWDPENIMSLNSVDSDLLNVHLSQYLPAMTSLDDVIAKLKTLSVYSELFKNECLNFSLSDFRNTLDSHVSTVMVRISSEFLNDKKQLLGECKLSTLIVNFGMFYKKQGDGQHCWAKRTMNPNGTYSVDSSPCLIDGKCKHTNSKCTMYSEGKVERNMKECIILNHVMTNGRYFNKGELDYNRTPVDEGTLIFYVPVHNVYGTEFKFIIDAPSNAKHLELMKLFEKIGLNPTVSDSLNGWRIYLSIPEVPFQSLFRINDNQYNNNFLCPRSIKPANER